MNASPKSIPTASNLRVAVSPKAIAFGLWLRLALACTFLASAGLVESVRSAQGWAIMLLVSTAALGFFAARQAMASFARLDDESGVAKDARSRRITSRNPELAPFGAGMD